MRDHEQGPSHDPSGHPRAFGLLPHTEVEFVVEGERVVLRKASGENRECAPGSTAHAAPLRSR